MAIYGVPTERAPSLGAISACVADDPGAACDAPGSVPAPAQVAGFRTGDVVASVEGKQVTTATDFTAAIRPRAGQATSVVVTRDGKAVTLSVTPTPVTRKLIDGSTQTIGAIGVGVQPTFVNEHYGPVGTVRESGTLIGTIITGTYETFTKKLGTITEVYGTNRDPAGFIGVVGASRVSGEIAAAPVSWQDRMASFVLLVAGLNLFVGIFNLLPLLPLDGGHIAVVFYEQVRDRLRRLRGYTGDLQRVDMNKLMPVTLAVVVLFASFTVYLLGADIVNPIRISQ